MVTMPDSSSFEYYSDDAKDVALDHHVVDRRKSIQSGISTIVGSQHSLHHGSLSSDGDYELLSNELPKSNRQKLVMFSLVGGMIHLALYNCILLTAPILAEAIPGYNPSSVVLPVGSIGALFGMILYFTRKDPIIIKHMQFGTAIIMAATVALLICVLAVYWGSLSQSSCTILMCILMFVGEFVRGYVSCLDYGSTVFFDKFGVNKTMSVGMAAGEGAIGVLPWVILLAWSPKTVESNINALIVCFVQCLIMSALYIVVCHNTFLTKSTELNLEIINRQRRKNLERTARKIEEGEQKLSCLSTWLKAVVGTRLVGGCVVLNMATTFTVYPQIFPFGYDCSVQETQILMGIFTLLDPTFRFLGFSIDKILKGKVVTKKLYLVLSILKGVVMTPILLIPYYATEGSSGFDQFWHYVICMVVLGVLQGGLTILGIYCYMQHLPDTQYVAFSSSLITVYLVLGVLLGQASYHLYPLFK